MKSKIILIGLMIFLSLSYGDQIYASAATDAARRDYQFQLDAYRNSYDQYILKRSEFEQNDSFANQEELVIAAKDMIIRRSKVWQTYFQVHKISVLDSPGMKIEIRDDLVNRLDQVILTLQSHDNLVSAITSRTPLLAEADKINQQHKAYIDLSYRAIFELGMANFNWSITQLQAFADRLQSEIQVQVRNPNERDFKLRGLTEVTDILRRLREIYDQTNTKIRQRDDESVKQENRYESMIEAFSPIYTDMLRCSSLIEEISSGLIL